MLRRPHIDTFHWILYDNMFDICEEEHIHIININVEKYCDHYFLQTNADCAFQD